MLFLVQMGVKEGLNLKEEPSARCEMLQQWNHWDLTIT